VTPYLLLSLSKRHVLDAKTYTSSNQTIRNVLPERLRSFDAGPMQ
jgi:hypothetical protein